MNGFVRVTRAVAGFATLAVFALLCAGTVGLLVGSCNGIATRVERWWEAP